MHALEQTAPGRPVDVAEGQTKTTHHVSVEALAVQDPGDVVDARGVDGGDDCFLVDVTHQGDLALDPLGYGPIRTQDQSIRLDTDTAQRRHGVLGGLGLQLPGGSQVGQQRNMQEEGPVPAQVMAHLPGGFEEGQRLDVADRSADLGDDDVDILGRHRTDAGLDLVGDVRDDLDCVAQVFAATLLSDHPGVDLSGGHVGDAGEVAVEEALVVPDVEVGLRTVVGDEHLTVLEGVHGARIHVEIGIEFLHGDPQATRCEQLPERGGRQALAERGGHAPGDENVYCRPWTLHGGPEYSLPALCSSDTRDESRASRSRAAR